MFYFIGGLWLLGCTANSSQSSDKQESTSGSNLSQTHLSEEHPIEVAELMAYFQRYADKLYFAGANQNWKLAQFYVHELEEASEKIIRNNIVDDGQNISLLMEQMMKPRIESFEKAIEGKQAAQFQTEYQALINTCNACHAASKHEYIQITIPAEPTYKNQNFKPSLP